MASLAGDDYGDRADDDYTRINSGVFYKVFAGYAFIRPDDNRYGQSIFAKISSFKNFYGCENLLEAVGVGDRANFRLVRAESWRSSRASCDYEAVDIVLGSKPLPESQETETVSTETLIRGASGVISDCAKGYGYIAVKSPIEDIAFFAGANTVGHNFTVRTGDLRNDFPIGTKVQFNLFRRLYRDKYTWYAVRVCKLADQNVSDSAEAKSNSGAESDLGLKFRSASSLNELNVSSTEYTHRRSVDDDFSMIDANENGKIALPLQPTVERKPSTLIKVGPFNFFAGEQPTHKSTQTEGSIENELLKQLFENENIFKVICQEQPDAVQTWIFKIRKNRTSSCC